MPKYKKSKHKSGTWGEDVEQALREVAAGKSLRSTALKYGMSEGLLRRLIKMKDNSEVLIGSGRPTALTKEAEQELSKCIDLVCKTGFSPTRAEIKNLVQNYVQNHKIKTPFKDNRPGKDWLRIFMKRNNLTMKKVNMICTARLSTTGNPFIIYDFYEKLEILVQQKKLKPAQIWNCDESGFPTDPAKCKVISTRGDVHSIQTKLGSKKRKYLHFGCLQRRRLGVTPINNIRWKEFSDNLAWAISTSEHNVWSVSKRVDGHRFFFLSGLNDLRNKSGKDHFFSFTMDIYRGGNKGRHNVAKTAAACH